MSNCCFRRIGQFIACLFSDVLCKHGSRFLLLRPNVAFFTVSYEVLHLLNGFNSRLLAINAHPEWQSWYSFLPVLCWKNISWPFNLGFILPNFSLVKKKKTIKSDRSFHVAWPLTCFTIVKPVFACIPVYYRTKSNKLITAKSFLQSLFIHVQFTRSTQYSFWIFSMGTLFVTLDKDTI